MDAPEEDIILEIRRRQEADKELIKQSGRTKQNVMRLGKLIDENYKSQSSSEKSEELAESHNTANKITRVTFMKVFAAAAAFIALLTLWPTGSEFNLTAPVSNNVERGFDPQTLPKNLSFSLKANTIKVFSEGDILTGELKPASSQSTPEELVLRVEIRGKDRDGTDGKFDGRLRLIRKTPNASIRNQSDLDSAILEGSFTVGTQTPRDVNRGYKP